MSKKHFIELADRIKFAKGTEQEFSLVQIELLADFCQSENCNFKRGQWLEYINGKCGKNGGKVKS